MGVRGVHFALTPKQYESLLAQPDDDARLEYVEEQIEKVWDTPYLHETETAWDAIHRCLTGNQGAGEGLDASAGSYPLNQAILGGRSLYVGEDYIISLIEPQAVRDVAEAMKSIDEAWLKRAYHEHCKGAWPDYGHEDCDYIWEEFGELRGFFTRMAPTGRAVIFTAAQ